MTPRWVRIRASYSGAHGLAAENDERLVELARRGSEAAFEAIVHRYSAPISRYSARLVGDSRADDVAQETMVRAHVALRRGDRVRTLGPWLHRIARNAALNGLRDQGQRSDPLDEAIAGGDPPDVAVERGQELRQVVEAVQALPDRQRDALLLREGEGRSYDEIAARLQVSDGAVRQLLHRARCSIRSGVAAISPFGALARLFGGAGDAGVLPRAGEVCAGAGSTGVAAKLCATTLIAAAAAGGGLPGTGLRHEHEGAAVTKAQAQQRSESVSTPAAGTIRTRPGSRTLATPVERGRNDQPPSTGERRQRERGHAEAGRPRDRAPGGQMDHPEGAQRPGHQRVQATSAPPGPGPSGAIRPEQREFSSGPGSEPQTRTTRSGLGSGETPEVRPG